jgi:hypothetical protein
MSIFIILLILLGFLMLFLCVIGLLLPVNWRIEQSADFRTGADQLYDLINRLDRWEDWSFWTTKNGYDMHVGGSNKGIGAKLKMESSKINALLTITHTVAPTELRYQLSLNKSKFVVEGTLLISELNAVHTQIAWSNSFTKYKGNNPFHRYQIYFLKKYVEQVVTFSINKLQQNFI